MRDNEVHVAYLLFRFKKWRPSEYLNMGAGERLITRAFLRQEAEEREQEKKEE